MTPEQIAENVNRLQREYSKHGKTVVNVPQTIDALVALVGEMKAGLDYPINIMQGDLETHLGKRCAKTMLTAQAKAAPIAELAKGEA